MTFSAKLDLQINNDADLAAILRSSLANDVL